MEVQDKFQVLFDNATKSFEEIIEEVTEAAPVSAEEFSIDSENALSVIIGITGVFNGRILINASVESAKNLAKAMNFGDELENEDDLFVYLAEFANMSCGRMATHMNDSFKERVVWLAPPAIFSANSLEIITPHISTQKKFYTTNAGNFIVDVGYNDGTLYDEF